MAYKYKNLQSLYINDINLNNIVHFLQQYRVDMFMPFIHTLITSPSSRAVNTPASLLCSAKSYERAKVLLSYQAIIFRMNEQRNDCMMIFAKSLN